MYDGAERTLLELLRHLDIKRYDITLLLETYDGIYLELIPKYIKARYLFRKDNNKYFGKIISSIKYRLWYRLMMKYPTLIHHLVLRENYDF